MGSPIVGEKTCPTNNKLFDNKWHNWQNKW